MYREPNLYADLEDLIEQSDFFYSLYEHYLDYSVECYEGSEFDDDKELMLNRADDALDIANQYLESYELVEQRIEELS